jgi:ribosomal-protein-alanine N-acetyltransferase
LHRVEVNIRPENRASLRVAHKLGFRPEGVRKNYLHIDGAWRDHATFAVTVEDAPQGLMPRWRSLVADMVDAGSYGYAQPDAERSSLVSLPSHQLPPDSAATHR